MYTFEDGTALTSADKIKFKKGITRAYLEYTDNGTTVQLTPDDYLISVDYSDEKADPEDGMFIGKAICRSIDLKINNTNNSLNLENKDLTYRIGIKVNNVYKYIKFGNFIVQKPENTDVKEETTLTALDYMSKFDQEYICGVTFPATLIDFANDVCTQCGVTLGSNSFRNSNKQVITANPFLNGETCREVVKSIAKLSFTVAHIGADNKLYFEFALKTTADEDITTDDYYELSPNTKLAPLNKVTLRSSEIPASGQSIGYKGDYSSSEQYLPGDIVKYNNTKYYCILASIGVLPTVATNWQVYTTIEIDEVKELIIEEDYFAYTDALRNTFLSEAPALYGLEYSPIEIDLTGSIYLNFKDLLQITNLNSNVLKTYCFNNSHTYNGVLYNSIVSPALTETEEKYSYQTEDVTYKKKTAAEIDKANQRITFVVGQIGDRSQKQTTVTQDIDTIASQVEDIEDLTREVSGTITVTTTDETINGGFLELHIYGNNTVFGYLFPSDNLFPSDTLYPMGSSKILVNNVSYELGIDDVLRQNGNVKDEYVLNRDGAKVIRRINTDGTIKSNPTEETLVAPNFQFAEGVNTISIVEYSANLKVVYVIRSTLTNIFATTVDMKSSIQQSANQIELRVDEKLEGVSDNDGKVTSGSIILAINNDESQATVNADKIKLEGYTTINEAVSIDTDGYLHASKGGTLAGFNITDFGLQANGILIASGGSGGSIIRNLNLVYAEGAPEVYGRAITTVRGEDDNNASIFHMNRIGRDAGINVIGTDGVNFNLYTSVSDPQLKKNIASTKVNGLDIINSIEHIEFNWKKDDKFQANGYNAENLIKVCEDFCDRVPQTGGEYESILNVKDFNILPYITKAIQELSKKNAELENRIIELERRLSNDKN